VFQDPYKNYILSKSKRSCKIWSDNFPFPGT